jgi:sugar phosphate isomerase/epimerase
VARIGLQLWTLRDACEQDLETVLHRLGAQGYEGVEFFGLLGHEPKEVRAWLDEARLVAIGRHAGLDELEEALSLLADEVAVLGTDRVALSWVDPGWFDQPHRVIERIEQVARAAHTAGLRFGFHNHAGELRPLNGGATFLDMLREFPPELLWLELDLGWAWYAGADPVAELAASRGRCPLVHVKDYRSREGHDDVPVGDGVVGYEHVVPAALAAGTEWLVVEEDEIEGDAFAAVERSLAALRRMLTTG